MAKYLLDTTVLIDHLRGQPEVVDLVSSLARQGHRMGLSGINIAELYSGLSQEEQAKAALLVDSLEFYELTATAGKRAGQFRYDFARQGISLSTTDTMIAAVALAEGAILITANIRDFPMIEIEVLDHSRI